MGNSPFKRTSTSCIFTKSPSAAYTNIVCESNDTVNLVVEPAFTRWRASQPKEELAGILSRGAIVSAQVSGRRSLALYPGLNIVGGIQPRGPRDVPMPDISIICLFRCRMGCAVGLRRSGIVMDISSDVDSAFVISSIELMSGDAAEDDMDISVVSEGVIDIEPESSGPKHRSGPQSSMF